MEKFSNQVTALLKDMTSTDKDFRFMAISDLIAALAVEANNFEYNKANEGSLVKMMIELVGDKDHEVQDLAVKCLGPLVGKIDKKESIKIVEALCQNMASGSELLKEASGRGLRVVIKVLPLSMEDTASKICQTIVDCLNEADENQEVNLILSSFDIMGDLLSRFGGCLAKHHTDVCGALFPHVANSRVDFRKKAMVAIGFLVVSCSQDLFDNLIDSLLQEMNEETPKPVVRTLVQCLETVARQASEKFAKHVHAVKPRVVQYVHEEGDDELRENCLQALESFVRQCPSEISTHLDEIVEIFIKYLRYDPNSNDDEDDMEEEEEEEEEEDMDMDDDNDEEDDFEEEFVDEDDVSWKIRRASAKCLESFVSSFQDKLVEIYERIVPVLLTCFKEREDNAKRAIFQAFISVMRQTGSSSDPSPVELLRSKIPQIVNTVLAQLKDKACKMRQENFSVLSELINVIPGALSGHMSGVLSESVSSLGDRSASANAKIDSLSFVNFLLKTHAPDVFHPHVATLLPVVVRSVQDNFYKISSEAVLALHQLTELIRPLGKPSSFDASPYTGMIYSCVMVPFGNPGVDREVKERAIACVGKLIGNHGDVIKTQELFSVFLMHLQNADTRMAAITALNYIAESPLQIDLNTVIPQVLPHLTSFLSRNQPASVQIQALGLLTALFSNPRNVISPDSINKILVELPSLVSEKDLHVSHFAISLLVAICRASSQSLKNISIHLMPAVLDLIYSPLLQGATLGSVIEFFSALVSSNNSGLSYASGHKMLTERVYQSTDTILHKQIYLSIVQCMAGMTRSNPGHALEMVTKYLTDLQSQSKITSVQIISALYIGEIGKGMDLSSMPAIKSALLKITMTSQSEEVNSAVSWALGRLAFGNIREYLPFVMTELNTKDKNQHCLLLALRDIIQHYTSNQSNNAQIQSSVPSIWNLLMGLAESEDESIRNSVSECLGMLILLDPRDKLSQLRASVNVGSVSMRSTVVTAVKNTILESPHPVDVLLREFIGDFLNLLKDEDINVRRPSLAVFKTLALNKPEIAVQTLSLVIPVIYKETAVRKELIRIVEMGPFKHKEDDGLEMRREIFEVMGVLLNTFPEHLDLSAFLTHLINGVKDINEIKLLSYPTLVRLVPLSPSSLVQANLPVILEALKKTFAFNTKPPTEQNPDTEKKQELVRSVLRVLAALVAVPQANQNPILKELLEKIQTSDRLKDLFASMTKITEQSSSANKMDTN